MGGAVIFLIELDAQKIHKYEIAIIFCHFMLTQRIAYNYLNAFITVDQIVYKCIYNWYSTRKSIKITRVRLQNRCTLNNVITLKLCHLSLVFEHDNTYF